MLVITADDLLSRVERELQSGPAEGKHTVMEEVSTRSVMAQ